MGKRPEFIIVGNIRVRCDLIVSYEAEVVLGNHQVRVMVDSNNEFFGDRGIVVKCLDEYDQRKMIDYLDEIFMK